VGNVVVQTSRNHLQLNAVNIAMVSVNIIVQNIIVQICVTTVDQAKCTINIFD